MSNVLINEDGSLRIRPGLRHMFNKPAPGALVGSFEPFFSAGGVRCILFAYRHSSGKLRFATAAYNPVTKVYDLDASLTTRFPGASEAALDLSASATYVRYVQIDNKILALNNGGDGVRLFFVSSAPRAVVPKRIDAPAWSSAHKPTAMQPAVEWINGSRTAVPTPRAASSTTLVSSVAADNVYAWWFFYTFSNEMGETPGSMGAVINTQRAWNRWTIGSGADDEKAEDQLAVVLPQAAWDAAVAAGATHWNLYYMTWSQQDNIPVEGLLIRQIDMKKADGSYKTRGEAGWGTLSPMLENMDASLPLPSGINRDNFTDVPEVANGLVAGDRLVLVYDTNNAARIHWTGNFMGEYLNLSSSKGGGRKTLTSGNLRTPGAVVLWQTPQSVDTITILCSGLDGQGSAYYMSPNTTVTNQSQTTVIMGFEETNATPGTVSPFGVEVLNNALYHPLENNIMKSTASNYNINHSYIADAIQNVWHSIPKSSKKKVISAHMDTELYYLVDSPTGKQSLAADDNGNQIWVCDTKQENAWSCWDVGGNSIQCMERDGLLYMGLAQGNSFFVFDPEHDSDDVWDASKNAWTEVGIAWSCVTNTMGSNRAHDAWSNVQQCNVTFGNFTGECEYGIRGVDVYGTPVEVRKHFKSSELDHSPLERFDQSDYLLIRRCLKEWEFFWESAQRPKNRSYGCVAFVQFTFTPATVNVGYEYGSVETFQYGSATPGYPNGVPSPIADTRLP